MSILTDFLLETPVVSTAVSQVYLGWLLFVRDIRVQAQKSLLGYFWLSLKTVMSMGPLIMIGHQFKLGGEHQKGPYALFATVGLLLWQLFWGSVKTPLTLLRRVRRILRNTLIPPFAIFIKCCFHILLECFATVILVCVLSAIYVPYNPALPLAILSMPVLMLCGYSLGMCIAPLELLYRDFRHALPFIAQLLLATAPVFYAMPDAGKLRLVNRLNPITYLIGIPRNWFVSGFSRNDFIFPVAVGFFTLIFFAGLRFHRRAMNIIIERM